MVVVQFATWQVNFAVTVNVCHATCDTKTHYQHTCNWCPRNVLVLCYKLHCDVVGIVHLMFCWVLWSTQRLLTCGKLLAFVSLQTGLVFHHSLQYQQVCCYVYLCQSDECVLSITTNTCMIYRLQWSLNITCKCSCSEAWIIYSLRHYVLYTSVCFCSGA